MCSQSLPTAVNEGLTETLVLRDGLKNGALLGHVAYGPLAQSRAAESEYVPASWTYGHVTHTHTHTH